MMVDSDLALGTLQTLARFQGVEVEPDHRGGAGPHPARDALRRVGAALARRRAHLLRQRRRHAAVRHAARRAAALGQPARGGRRAAARRRPRAASGSTSSATATATATSSTCARRDRGLRNQGWKDSRDSDPLRRRHARASRRSRCARCRATCTRALIARSHFAHRAGRRRLRRRAPRARRGAQASVQPATSGSRSTAGFAMGLDRDKTPLDALDVEHGSLPVDRHRRRGQGARSSPQRLLSTEMFCGWGIRTLASIDDGLQPDQLPQRQRLAARQRDLRRGAHALRLRRRSAPRDGGHRRRGARRSATGCPSCSRARRATSSRSR